jgi:hypothetical protein
MTQQTLKRKGHPNFRNVSVRPGSKRLAELAAAQKDESLVKFASEALDIQSLKVLKKAGVPLPPDAVPVHHS